MDNRSMPDVRKLTRWLDRQRERDPKLYKAMQPKLEALEAVRFTPETNARPLAESAVAAAVMPIFTIETIVREGRPALFVKDNAITRDDSFIDAPSEVIVERLESARATIEPLLPLVGRIDVANYASGQDFLGTGWLVAEDVIVTNRHVAELLARRGIDRYEFVMGRFGERVAASIGYGHEVGRPGAPSAAIEEILFVEPTATGPDIAFLKVARRSDGTMPKFIELAASDPQPGDDVVVVGYPARATVDAIPDQDRMERLFGRSYDVKRAAPGKIDDPSRGWTTHDCTTLGGNSGSVVLSMSSGQACALHFAGLYLIENYAVPAATLRSYLGRRPWPYRLESATAAGAFGSASPVTPASVTPAATLTIPLTLSISLTSGVGAAVQLAPPEADGSPLEAARALRDMLDGPGVLAVRPGVIVENEAMRDQVCLVVAAHPDRLGDVAARVPGVFRGLTVQVRPASLDDQLGLDQIETEAPRSIAYDDDARTGADFRLDWVQEDMRLRLHVGPDRGFEQLSVFLAGTRSELVSSMYQFFADHVRAAVDGALAAPAVHMKLVADPMTRDHDPAPPAGQFDRAATFATWRHTARFENIYVPEGNGGLVDNAYHIKVTVRDGDAFWLSSGNWTRSSQPLIPTADRLTPAKISRAGNREWHVIGESTELATRFRNHILQDFKRCGELGGRPESLDRGILVDVPETYLEAMELEAAAGVVFEPEDIAGEIRVKPLLTPDHAGGVFCDAVLELVNSASSQLLFQNQYIKVTPSTSPGRFSAIVDALARAAQRIADCRIILRSDGSGFWDNVAELRRRGVDVSRQVRRLANTHTKGIVVDGRTVLVGSHNWSQSGVTVNRDASLVIDDPRAADYFARVFEVDWSRASELTQAGPEMMPLQTVRLATSAAPPAGFKRIPLAQLFEG